MGDTGIDETTPRPWDVGADDLMDEARRLAAEVVATRRSLRADAPPDVALVARLSRCYDRLDDIAAVIGLTAVTQIFDEASAGRADND